MNEGMLSQAEIDALLNGGNEDNNKTYPTDQYLSSMEQDALGEIGNISFGNSATALSNLLKQKVEITTPEISLVLKKDLEDEFPHPYVAVVVDYTSGFTGSNVLVIHERDAKIIADLMLGGTGENPPPTLSELELSAVQEAMNQMMGSAATSMSTIFHKRVEISPPTIDILNIPEGEGTETLPEDDLLVKVSFQLKVGDLINSNIMQLIPISFAKEMVESLMVESSQENKKFDIDEYFVEEKENEQANHSFTKSESENLSHNHLTNEKQQNEKKTQQKEVQPAIFSDFSTGQPEVQEPRNLDILYDIPLQVTVELGRTKKLVKEILELSPGSIIELDKLAGEPVDILVNNRLIAQGEVVVIDENFGVRITDIISQSDRIKKMK